jgi:hypothetical protein
MLAGSPGLANIAWLCLKDLGCLCSAGFLRPPEEAFLAIFWLFWGAHARSYAQQPLIYSLYLIERIIFQLPFFGWLIRT